MLAYTDTGKGWRTKQTLMMNTAFQSTSFERRLEMSLQGRVDGILHSIEITVKLLLWNTIILKLEVIAYVTRIIPFLKIG